MLLTLNPSSKLMSKSSENPDQGPGQGQSNGSASHTFSPNPGQVTPAAAGRSLEELIECYGDMIFDLCESVLWSSQNAQLAFRLIAKDLKKRRKWNIFKNYERTWVLRVTYKNLLLFAEKHARRPTPFEKIELDANQNISVRLNHFNEYFHRLCLDDQILLLLKDKYGLPYPEISSAMNISEGSLKIRRQQALRTLEEWLWDQQ
jgi:DNA-directed RNA polymerase specialized sigma24 family protein